jgi:hypothetical protein
MAKNPRCTQCRRLAKKCRCDAGPMLSKHVRAPQSTKARQRQQGKVVK